MGYRNLRQCLDDLERTGQLIRLDVEVDAHLEAAEIQRRVYQAGGPAILFQRVRGSRFPLVSNLFGTLERARFLFRDTLQAVHRLVELKADPAVFWQRPWSFRRVPRVLWTMRPRRVRRGPVLTHRTTVSRLPHVTCWPDDGGAFVTLPQVYTEDPRRPGFTHSNLGMYRIQLSGGEYEPDREVGLHYQIHRSIGVHHAAAIERGERLRVNVFVGGTPAMMLAAVMPLPEGLSELMFAGALAGRRIPLIDAGLHPVLRELDASAGPHDRPGTPALPVYAEADFAIVGTVDPHAKRPEGPFGDHLGYYSLVHEFPVLRVEGVFHRPGAVWPFTVVGRPPQEDTTFGKLIHELTGPAIPAVIPGVHAVHAVDAAGVHPLLLAIGSERYVPYADQRRPQELLTCASAILGQGQLSLAKYLWIVAREDDPGLNVADIPAFFAHVLRRADWENDLHFHTRTTIDTLDYSGHGFNQGSKLVVAVAGPPRRDLPVEVDSGLDLPDGFSEPELCLPGVLAVRAPRFEPTFDEQGCERAVSRFCAHYDASHPINAWPLIVLADDSRFTAESLRNFLWVVFTRSDPAADVHGIGAFVDRKHWGCRGSLVIDARIKPHHAPPLVEDPEVSRRVDRLAERGGPLYGVI